MRRRWPAATALGFLVFASEANRAAVCDALSPVWLSAMRAVGGAVMLGLAMLEARAAGGRGSALAAARGRAGRRRFTPGLAALPARLEGSLARARAAVARPGARGAADLAPRLADRGADRGPAGHRPDRLGAAVWRAGREPEERDLLGGRSPSRCRARRRACCSGRPAPARPRRCWPSPARPRLICAGRSVWLNRAELWLRASPPSCWSLFAVRRGGAGRHEAGSAGQEAEPGAAKRSTSPTAAARRLAALAPVRASRRAWCLTFVDWARG